MTAATGFTETPTRRRPRPCRRPPATTAWPTRPWAPPEVEAAIDAANRSSASRTVRRRPRQGRGPRLRLLRHRSYALIGAKLLKTARLRELHALGRPRQGEWITVYTNPGHAFVVIARLRLDTSAAGDPRAARPPLAPGAALVARLPRAAPRRPLAHGLTVDHRSRPLSGLEGGRPRRISMPIRLPLLSALRPPRRRPPHPVGERRQVGQPGRQRRRVLVGRALLAELRARCCGSRRRRSPSSPARTPSPRPSTSRPTSFWSATPSAPAHSSAARATSAPPSSARRTAAPSGTSRSRRPAAAEMRCRCRPPPAARIPSSGSAGGDPGAKVVGGIPHCPALLAGADRGGRLLRGAQAP